DCSRPIASQTKGSSACPPLSTPPKSTIDRMQDLPCARNGRPPLTFPERLAGALATQVGSWRFLLIQSIFFAAWIVANVALDRSMGPVSISPSGSATVVSGCLHRANHHHKPEPPS